MGVGREDKRRNQLCSQWQPASPDAQYYMQKASLSEKTHRGIGVHRGSPWAVDRVLEFLSTGMGSSGQVTGSKAMGRREKVTHSP